MSERFAPTGTTEQNLTPPAEAGGELVADIDKARVMAEAEDPLRTAIAENNQRIDQNSAEMNTLSDVAGNIYDTSRESRQAVRAINALDDQNAALRSQNESLNQAAGELSAQVAENYDQGSDRGEPASYVENIEKAQVEAYAAKPDADAAAELRAEASEEQIKAESLRDQKVGLNVLKAFGNGRAADQAELKSLNLSDEAESRQRAADQAAEAAGQAYEQERS